MFDELEKYRDKGHFFLKQGGNLSEVCNAPTNKSGVYLVFALSNGTIELVYIGMSGQEQADGTVKVRTAGLGGIKDRIVNGHQFGKIPRHKSWPHQMQRENIEALDVYWYVTWDGTINDVPRDVEWALLKKHFQIYRRLPRWNNGI